MRLSLRSALLAAFFVISALSSLPARAASPDIVISQVYGGGGNSGALFTHDFVELFNRGTTTVSLSGWSLQYTSATGAGNFGAATNQITPLSGSIAPGQRMLIQEATNNAAVGSPLPTPDITDGTPINMSGTGGKVALVNTTTPLGCNGSSTLCSSGTLATIVDLVGWDGANFFEGAGAAPATSNTTAIFRANGGCTDTDNNASDFAAAAPSPRNSASPLAPCAGPMNPTAVGAANPSSVFAGDPTLLTVTVSPGANPTSTGITVTVSLTPIGGPPSQAFVDDGTSGDAIAGDNVFSYQATVSGATSTGAKSLSVSVSDAQLRSASATISLTVLAPPMPIHEIQGSGRTSPYAGQVVTTRGVVTGRRFNNGFFIQTPDADADSDPNTSEGLFVFTSSAPPAAAGVGNEVRVTGTVQEFVPSADPFSPPLTEIAGSPTVTLLSTGNPLPAAATLTAADTAPAGSLEQLERSEGMRVRVDSLTVVAPTDGTPIESQALSNSNGVFYGVITGLSRPFREPGVQVPDPLPAGSPCCVPRFDTNPERLRVDSDGLVGAAKWDVATGDVLSDVTGPLDYGFRTYTILPDPGAPALATTAGATSVPPADPEQLTVASFNMERFFDDVNDPAIGEPVLTAAAFQNRLNKASLTIRNVMQTPDILGVAEVENLTTLQALAAKINADAVAAAQPDPAYLAYLEEGNDIGGIDVGFLAKSSKVAVQSVVQEGKDTTWIDPSDNAPHLLNDRPSLVLDAFVNTPAGTQFPVTVIVNHLRSLNGVDDPSVDGPTTVGDRVRQKRRRQAEFLAELVQARQDANPAARIVLVGDLNAFQFNDGYVDSIGTIKGTPTPADEVVLASGDLVNPDLADLVDLAPADQLYSFVFDGNAQELDHVLVSQSLAPNVNGLFYGRSNADFPESLRGDANRPERLSDHDSLVAYFDVTPPAITAVTASPNLIWPPNNKMVPVTIAVSASDLSGTPTCTISGVSSNEPDATSWSINGPLALQVRASRNGSGNGGVYTITVTCSDASFNASSATTTVSVPHDQRK